MGKWKVGFVGMGFLNRMGSGYASQFDAHPDTEVSAMCDIRAEVLERNGREFNLDDSRLFANYDELLASDVEIIVIATPIPFHENMAVKALEAGKHVLSEVTMASTVEGCFRIIEAQKKSGNVYMMAENYCYFHFIRQWTELVRQGKLGKIYYAEGEYLHEIRHMIVHPETKEVYWRANRPPIHYCSHNLGPLLSIMDDRIVKATASGTGIHMIENVGPGAIDIQVALFETEKGATIKLLRSSVLAREPQVVFYSVYGTKGFLETNRSRDSKNGLQYFEGEPGYEHGAQHIEWQKSDPNVPQHVVRLHGTSEYFIVNEFMESIRNHVQPRIDAVRASEFTIPGLIAHEAAMKGNVWLDVPRYLD